MRRPAEGPGLTRDAAHASGSAPQARSPLKFFLLVFAIFIPFRLIGGVSDLQSMPGLSWSALAAVCPMVAALILVHRERRTAGVTELLRRSFDFERIRAKRWYAPILVLMAGVNLAVYGLMRWMDTPMPATQIGVLAASVMFFAFFVAALGEELGWSGYITDPLQERWNALQTGVILGLARVVWHLVPLLLIGTALRIFLQVVQQRHGPASHTCGRAFSCGQRADEATVAPLHAAVRRRLLHAFVVRGPIEQWDAKEALACKQSELALTPMALIDRIANSHAPRSTPARGPPLGGLRQAVGEGGGRARLGYFGTDRTGLPGRFKRISARAAPVVSGLAKLGITVRETVFL